MEFKPLFYSYLVICLIVFFDVLINVKKKSLLKICFLLIIAGLFVMNYFSYTEIMSRSQFVLVKSMRYLYLSSTILLIIHISSSKISRWIISLMLISFIILIGMRLFYFNEIDLLHHQSENNLVFSIAYEFYKPLPVFRFALLGILGLVLAILLYYCSIIFKKSYTNNMYYNQLCRWVIFFITPSFLLILFGIFSLLNIFNHSFPSGYIFSLFSLLIVISILFRPKFLNSSQVSLAFIPFQKPAESSVPVQLFNNVFFNNFYYLQQDASLVQLAEKLNVPEIEARQFLQKEYGMTMNDLLNKFRVAYMIDLLGDPQNRDFTIEHISQKAGFPSRTTMYRAFSKYHGGSPSDYLDKLSTL